MTLRISDESLGAHVRRLKRLRMPLLVMLIITVCLYLQPKLPSSDATASRSSVENRVKQPQAQTTKAVAVIAVEPNAGDQAQANSHSEVAVPETQPEPPPRRAGSSGSPEPAADRIADFVRSLEIGERLRLRGPSTVSVSRAIASLAKRVAVAKSVRAIDEVPQADPIPVIERPETRAVTDELVLCNQAVSGGTIAFLIDDAVHRLAPGEEVRLAQGSPRTLRFHRGGNLGESKQILETGVFEFRVTSAGWALVEVTLDDRP